LKKKKKKEKRKEKQIRLIACEIKKHLGTE
jgi:hypothetical protein